jgi:hypothetical protein
VSLNPGTLVGGESSTGTVTLGSAAPVGGVAVALSSDPAAAPVPAPVTINVLPSNLCSTAALPNT